jgi:restriction endonuclease Mrr
MPAIRPVLITTGPVTSGSRELADTCGVVLLDGPELARFLCLCDVAVDEIFVYDPPRLQFDAVGFRAWVSA